MIENNSILQKLDGLEARFEEVSTLITDPSVISDQERYVKLTKEYKDLEDIMNARKRYITCLNAISEAKDILTNETDPDMKEMAREELSENEALKPKLEEEIKIALIPKDPTRLVSLPVTFSRCIRNSAIQKAGLLVSPAKAKVPSAASRKSTLPSAVSMYMAL